MDRERKGIAIYPHLYMKESRFGNFRLQAWRFTKEIGMKHGENTVAIRYRIQTEKKCPVTLEVTPFFQFTKKGEDLSPEQKMARRENVIASNGLELKFTTNGTVVGIERNAGIVLL